MSASTRQFLENVEREMGIHSIPFSDIPVKSPDALPMDLCVFGSLKKALGSRIPRIVSGLWKACQEDWNKWTPLFFEPACCSGNSDAER